MRRQKNDSSPEEAILSLLQEYQGIAIGEQHGEMAIPEFMVANMKKFKEAGVKKLFIEMIPSRFNPAARHFNATGEDNVEFPITPHLGEPVYSKWEVANLNYALNVWDNKYEGMKEQYMAILHAAHDCGIEVIGMDGHEAAGRQRLEKSNPHWAAIIQENIADLKPGEKYLAYGGYFHFSNMHVYEDTTRVNHMVNPPIPSVRFDSCKKDRAFVFKQPSPDEADLVVLLPESPNQRRDSSYHRDDDSFAYQNLINSTDVEKGKALKRH
jgi:hypothetical protein